MKTDSELQSDVLDELRADASVVASDTAGVTGVTNVVRFQTTR